MVTTDENKTEGRKKGFQEGVRKGIEQGIEKVAMRLLQSGEMNDDNICKITGLSEQQLLKIKHKIN